jgi:hypothetical protein
MKPEREKSIFELLWVFTLIGGIIILLAGYITMIARGLFYKNTLFYLTLGLIYLVPYRYTLSKPLYLARMFIFIVLGGVIVRGGITNIYDELLSPFWEWIIVIINFTLIIFGVSAPLSLYLKKRLSKTNRLS